MVGEQEVGRMGTRRMNRQGQSTLEYAIVLTAVILAIAAAAKGADASRPVLEGDARDSQEFVDRWTPRVQAMPNARHAKMLKLILGEVLEQKRFFEQALAGRTDLLGRRGEQLGPAHGEVLASRWIE